MIFLSFYNTYGKNAVSSIFEYLDNKNKICFGHHFIFL